MAQTLEEARKYREENVQGLFGRLQEFKKRQEWEQVIELGELILPKVSPEDKDARDMVEKEIRNAKDVKKVAW